MSDNYPIIYPWNQTIWQALSLESERSNHALLLHGDAGLGKKDLALSLAHSVIAQQHRQSANLFSAGSHPDLHVLMPECEASDDLLSTYAQRYLESHTGKPKRHITIEPIRKLTDAISTYPHISSHRVILLIAAHTMNINAANALLKSLEEPPANTLFVLVSDDVARIAKTVRSRCSLIAFNAPDTDSAQAWLRQQKVLPEEHIASHLAMANNRPLQAIDYFNQHYLESLKAIFTDVNSLWAGSGEATQIAKNWQDIGAQHSIDVLQKLTTDLLRCQLSDNPPTVYFPVQKSWIQSRTAKFSLARLLQAIDELNYAKKMLATTVDELLVLETVSIKMQSLPS